MSPSQPLLEIEKLTVPQRLELIGLLWDSIPSEEPAPLTDDQKQELDRRIAALDANPDSGRPWEEVEARILARLKK
jgi:putative addiction module component (TIGR02574 family)